MGIARELKVTVIPIVAGSLGTVLKYTWEGS